MNFKSTLLSIATMSVLSLGMTPVFAAEPPVKADNCYVYATSTTKWPMRRLHMRLSNVSTNVADDVTLDVADTGNVTDRVVLAPGATTEYDVPVNAKLTSMSPSKVDCSVTAVTFRDGQPTWLRLR